MKKKALSLILCLLMAVSLLTGCGSQADEETITIGVLSALTGTSANYGLSEKNAAMLAEEDLNAAGGINGKKVKIVVEDTAASPQEGVNACRKLIEQDGACMIVGPAQSGVAMACASLCNEAKVPLLATFATNPKVTLDDSGNVHPYVYRICFTDPYQGKVLSEYAFSELGKTKAAILYNISSDYAAGLNQFFEESFTSLGGEIVAKLAYKDGDVDFRSQLSELKDKDFDVILLPNVYKEIALIAEQMADLGIDAQIVAGDTAMSTIMIDMAGEAVDGLISLGHFSNDEAPIRSFMDRYKEVYKQDNDPEPNSVLCYDGIMLAADCIKRAGSTDGEALAKAVNETRSFEMMHCSFTMNPDTHNPYNKAATIFQIQDGKQIMMIKFEPQGQE